MYSDPVTHKLIFKNAEKDEIVNECISDYAKQDTVKILRNIGVVSPHRGPQVT